MHPFGGFRPTTGQSPNFTASEPLQGERVNEAELDGSFT